MPAADAKALKPFSLKAEENKQLDFEAERTEVK
jgi:hypothetical protein